MTTLCSYDLNGKKLSFANWISNLSPQETPFTSMTGKESIQQTVFQWQTDYLEQAGDNAQVEGAVAVDTKLRTTKVLSNNTQILRKTVKVSDTANALANYGRGKELQYQMEKAGKEIKRDLEHAFLNNKDAVSQEIDGQGRKTAGFIGLVAPKNHVDIDTEAVVHRNTLEAGKVSEKDIFDMTYNLYLAGSSANIIMFHPTHAPVFSALQEKGTTRQRIFENTPIFSVYVSTIVDPLGQEYKLIPNRWMPMTEIFFFDPKDWTQMVLRAPSRTKLAKDGSYEKWMVEMEVGLRHRNQFASGVLDLQHDDDEDAASNWDASTKAKLNYKDAAGADQTIDIVDNTFDHLEVLKGSTLKITDAKSGAVFATSKVDGAIVTIYKDNAEFGHWTKSTNSSGVVDSTGVEYLMTSDADAANHNGIYVLKMVADQKDAVGVKKTIATKSFHITVVDPKPNAVRSRKAKAA